MLIRVFEALMPLARARAYALGVRLRRCRVARCVLAGAAVPARTDSRLLRIERPHGRKKRRAGSAIDVDDIVARSPASSRR